MELDLARGVRAIAQFVLESLKADPVDRAVRRPARQEEAREPPGSLRGDEERVAHRRGEEPLVADDSILGPRPAASDRSGARRVGAQVRPALLLRHPHPEEDARLVGRGAEAPVVPVREDLRQPRRGDLGLSPQRRDRGVGHRRRTHDARLDLPEEEDPRGARDVRAGPRVRPWTRVQPILDREPEQRVPRGVVLDLVASIARAIVGVEDGWMPVRQEPELDRLFLAEELSQPRERRVRPARALANDRLSQRLVIRKEIGAAERRHHVRDLMRTKREVSRIASLAH